MKLSEMLAEEIVEGYGKNESHCQMEMKHPEALEGMHHDKMVESMCEAAIDCMNHNTPKDMSRKMIAEMAGKYLKEKYGHKHEDVMKVHDLIESSIAASDAKRLAAVRMAGPINKGWGKLSEIHPVKDAPRGDYEIRSVKGYKLLKSLKNASAAEVRAALVDADELAYAQLKGGGMNSKVNYA